MKPPFAAKRAFTIVELLVSVAILAVIVVLLTNMVNFTTSIWRHGSDQVESFAGARGALSLIGRELQGCVVDLDLGYVIQKEEGDPKKISLKYLSRRTPIGEDIAAVEKVAYQLAWASTGILPTITPRYDEKHSNPVLIRTVNFQSKRGLNDVFDARTKDAWTWVRNWGTLKDEVRAGTEGTGGDITEVIADNIIGWQVNFVYWNKTLAIDEPEEGRYFDDGNSAIPKYVTSDLKYVKKADPATASSIPSTAAPRAIEIRLATVASSAMPRLRNMADWGEIRTHPNLFQPDQLGNTPMEVLLRQNIRYFDATYYLASKTP
jgi:prepilin-type N-terminal cleavage/methylation domain-containing protein